MADSSETDRLYREGVAAIRAGDKATGREKLMKVVEQDQLHEQAWLWLSTCVDTDEERIICLQNVLTINPRSEAALKGLSKLGASLPGDDTGPEPPSSQIQASPSPGSELPPEEQWRAGLLEKPAGDGEYVSDAILIPSCREPAPRTLLDLTSAWANALIFKIIGPYDEEVQYGSVPHILININVAVFLQVLAALLFFVLLLAVGRNPDSLLSPAIQSLNEMLAAIEEFNSANWIYPALRPAYNYLVAATGGGSIPRISPEVAAAFGTIFAVYLILTVLLTFVGQMFLAIAVNAVAERLGGKGDIIQLTLALTIGLVATSIVQIPVWLLAPFSPAILAVGSLVASIYQFLQMANAVKAAHKLNILVSMGTVIIAGTVMSMVVGCLFFAISLIPSL
ncbi:MAG: YIP1 family protein [Anaerolineae bacterium]|nr:YIP1 family protein [Anaerolineae bacterium]